MCEKMSEEFIYYLLALGKKEIKGVKIKIKDLPVNSGFYKVLNGLCPIKTTDPLSCFTCIYGHLTECHYPKTCEEEKCSHYINLIKAEEVWDEEDE